MKVMFRWSESHMYWVAVQDSNSVCLTLQPVILTSIPHLITDVLERHCYRKIKLTYITSCMCLQATHSYYTCTHLYIYIYIYTHTHTHIYIYVCVCVYINTCAINILFGTPGKYFFTINNCRKKRE